MSNTNVKFPSKGISGKMFLAIEAVLLAILFAGAMLFIAPTQEVIINTLGAMKVYLLEVAIKLGLVVVIGFVQAYILFAHVLDTPLWQLKGKCEKSRNDSQSILLLGVLATVAVMIVSADGVGVAHYLYQIMTRGALGFALSTVVTIIVARWFGVKSMDQFRDWVDVEDNDSFAILVAGISVISMALMMSV